MLPRVILAVLFWFGSSVALTIYNKWLLSKYGFEFPATIIVVHMFLQGAFAGLKLSLDAPL